MLKKVVLVFMPEAKKKANSLVQNILASHEMALSQLVVLLLQLLFYSLVPVSWSFLLPMLLVRFCVLKVSVFCQLL